MIQSEDLDEASVHHKIEWNQLCDQDVGECLHSKPELVYVRLVLRLVNVQQVNRSEIEDEAEDEGDGPHSHHNRVCMDLASCLLILVGTASIFAVEYNHVHVEHHCQDDSQDVELKQESIAADKSNNAEYHDANLGNHEYCYIDVDRRGEPPLNFFVLKSLHVSDTTLDSRLLLHLLKLVVE